jgi:predicted nucleotidyltransferase
MIDSALDMPPQHLAVACDILARNAGAREIWPFGSRARGAAKPYSDLDLVVIREQPLDIAELAQLADAFEESDLPWRVDIVEWATTDTAFRRIIERDKRVLSRPNRS